jgi:hypothetical protein
VFRRYLLMPAVRVVVLAGYDVVARFELRGGRVCSRINLCLRRHGRAKKLPYSQKRAARCS